MGIVVEPIVWFIVHLFHVNNSSQRLDCRIDLLSILRQLITLSTEATAWKGQPTATNWRMLLNKSEMLSKLPAVDEILRCEALVELRGSNAHDVLVGWIRDAIKNVRNELLNGRSIQFEALQPRIVQQVLQRQELDQHQMIQPVINATGIILHTNLGRAPLAKLAMERMQRAAAYTNLELDLESGKRSRRGARVTDLLARLTGAEDALVVNNCAGATVLALQAIAMGREVVIARGQLVEIGGGFRLPDVFRSAGVSLREVGTTNRTYLSDYESAINDSTGAVLRVHRSNFAQIGFVTEPTIDELVMLRRPSQVPIIDDLGSGSMADLSKFGLNEPLVSHSIQAGADLCLFSGDKLFGGPQAGILVGKTLWIERLRESPLMRALRADKVTLAALEATAEIHLRGDAFEQIPVLQMLSQELDLIHASCLAVHERLSKSCRARVNVVACNSQLGGGTLPAQTLPSYGLSINGPKLDALAKALRLGSPPTLCRLTEGRLVLDLRTVGECQIDALANRLCELLSDDAEETF